MPCGVSAFEVVEEPPSPGAMLVGFLIWGETLNAWMLAGAAVVVASGIYMIRLVAPRG